MLAAAMALSACSVSVRPGQKLTIGAAASSAGAFTAATGVTPGIFEHYIQFGDPFTANFAGPATPFIQIEPRNTTLTSITASREDGWLRAYARAVAVYHKPVILGFAPEMNGDWYSWGYRHASPAAYIAAWRHVMSVFRAAGARNVTWIWTVSAAISGSSTPSMQVSSSIRQWWPGSQWVKLVGMDGYYYLPSQDFAGVFGATLTRVHALTSQPVLISETAVAPAAGQAAKIPGLFIGARAAGVIGLVWFDLHGRRDWRLQTTSALAAFRQAAKE